MASPKVNDDGTPSVEATKAPTSQEQPPPEGSLRSLLRKASDFAKHGQRIIKKTSNYPKYRRYVHLEIASMFDALVDLYTQVFQTQWTIFKRVADSMVPQGTKAEDAQRYLASVYISHFILDLYHSVKESVLKLTSVAHNQHFLGRISATSNEYDDFLILLNAAIRPTHVVGCYEDVMFIPLFPADSDFQSTNPFNITGFARSQPQFKAILNTIKDKRAGWKTSTISSETVGRPSWLFDWFSEDLACSWFPQEGNFNAVDIAVAYILGVACTPKLAHIDDDVWQPISPSEAGSSTIDLRKYPRKSARTVYADYEVEQYSLREEKFYVFQNETDPRQKGKGSQKRPRNRYDDDDSIPRNVIDHHFDPDEMAEEHTLHVLIRKTYLYHSRVVFRSDEVERLNGLLTIILDPVQHCT